MNTVFLILGLIVGALVGFNVATDRAMKVIKARDIYNKENKNK